MSEDIRLIKNPTEVPSEDYYVSGHRTCGGCGPALGTDWYSRQLEPKQLSWAQPAACTWQTVINF